LHENKRALSYKSPNLYFTGELNISWLSKNGIMTSWDYVIEE
jgi:hypothetical protein